MHVIAAWVPQVMLHVADDGILPLDEIDPPIGSNFYIGWAEIWIVGKHD